MDRSEGAFPAISTKEELLQRLRYRHKPSVQARPQPSSLDVRDIANAVDHANERRIARLRKGLGQAHSRLEEQHSFARLGGFAASRFNRER